MGKMKELAMDLANEWYHDKRALKERLKNETPRDQAWTLSQLGGVKNYFDSEGYALHEPIKEPTLSDKAFIGGEGIPRTLYKLCRQCLWDFNSVLGMSFSYRDNSYRLRSETCPELEFTIQDDEESCPVDELQRCSCGNWMWDRAGHDILLEEVARGEMSVAVATAWINRNLSWNLDTRAYNEDFINTAIINWETRWRA
jgi:hypothetical protein